MLDAADRLAYKVGASGAVEDVVLIEAKNAISRPQSMKMFTALGGNSAGEQFERNLLRAQDLITKRIGNTGVALELQEILARGGGRVVIFGPQGLRVTEDTLQSLRNLTRRSVDVIIDPTLNP